MANTIQVLKGLEANRAGITPVEGQFVYTTDDKKVYIGDGTTAGGNPVGGGNAGIEAVASGALSNGSMVILNSDGTVSIVAETVSGTTIVTNLTATNFIGISDGAYLTTETATIQTISAINEAQSGLTPALKYYVQTDGTLSTTPDTPSVYAGKALSATNLIIKG